MMWLWLWGCAGGNALDDAWVGSWQVDTHLEGEGCGYPVDPAEPQWDALEVAFLDLSGIVGVSVARCNPGGGCDLPAYVLPLEVAEERLLISTQSVSALVAGISGTVCQVAINSVVIDQPEEGALRLHAQQYFDEVEVTSEEECTSLADELVEAVCDFTTHIEARR